MRRILFSAAVIASAIVATSTASAATFQAQYRLSLSGIPIGRLDVSSASNGNDYAIEAQGRLTGLVGLFTSGHGAASAAGTVRNGRVEPTRFALETSASRQDRTVRMAMSRGAVTQVEADPVDEPHPHAVPLADSHRRGVVDPVSAFVLAPHADLAIDDPRQCERTVPVFDGSSRFDLAFSYGGGQAVNKPGYAGPVLVCRVRYVPVAGHRPDRDNVRFMVENRDIAVWLAPIGSLRSLVPMRVEVRTQIGMSVADAMTVAIGGSP